MLKQFIPKIRFKRLLVLGVAAGGLLIVGSWLLISVNSRGLIYASTDQSSIDGHGARVAIVFGAAVRPSGQPSLVLAERLATGAELLESGQVDKLIVSGDNSTANYDEPTAMRNYLVNTYGIDPELIQPDFAGRSTYATCERAAKVFGLTRAVLVSESTHLPRAIYTCDSFGVDSIGVKSDGRAHSRIAASQSIREIMARTVAVINVHLVGRDTVLGDPIDLQA